MIFNKIFIFKAKRLFLYNCFYFSWDEMDFNIWNLISISDTINLLIFKYIFKISR